MSKMRSNLKLFPTRLKQARESKGLLKKDLEIKSGVTKCSIIAYEKGIRLPSSFALVALADALDISTDWLLGRRE